MSRSHAVSALCGQRGRTPNINLVCLIDVLVSLLLTGYIKKLLIHSSWFLTEIYFVVPKSKKQKKTLHFPHVLCTEEMAPAPSSALVSSSVQHWFHETENIVSD